MTEGSAGIVVVFGLDPKGRPRAARFEMADEAVARRAAQALGYQFVRLPQGNAIGDRLKVGRLYRTQSTFAPVAGKSIYAIVSALAEIAHDGAVGR